MHFRVLGKISDVETIARGKELRHLLRLRKRYGGRAWRKLKGLAQIKLSDGTICEAEIHWYEAHGVGRKELKIKEIIEP